jgi:hypothetical protein
MKDVVMIRIDGARLITVTNPIIWIIRPVASPPAPPKSMFKDCAKTEFEIKKKNITERGIINVVQNEANIISVQYFVFCLSLIIL